MRDSLVDTVRYFVVVPMNGHDPTLYRQQNNAAPETFSIGVEALTVRRISTSMFEIILTARADRADTELMPNDGYRRRTLRTEVRVRNLAI